MWLRDSNGELRIAAEQLGTGAGRSTMMQFEGLDQWGKPVEQALDPLYLGALSARVADIDGEAQGLH